MRVCGEGTLLGSGAQHSLERRLAVASIEHVARSESLADRRSYASTFIDRFATKARKFVLPSQ